MSRVSWPAIPLACRVSSVGPPRTDKKCKFLPHVRAYFSWSGCPKADERADLRYVGQPVMLGMPTDNSEDWRDHAIRCVHSWFRSTPCPRRRRAETRARTQDARAGRGPGAASRHCGDLGLDL